MDAVHANPAAAPPRLTRALTLLLAAVALACQLPRLRKPLLANFALTPSATLGQSKLWNVLTAGLVDPNPASAAAHTALFFLTARWIEAAWRPRPLLAYLALVSLAAGAATYLALLAAYVATRRPAYFFTPVATAGGLVAALLVAIKQLVPEHRLAGPAAPLAATHLPLLLAALHAAAAAARLQPPGNALFVAAAVHAAWLYLRFVRPPPPPPRPDPSAPAHDTAAPAAPGDDSDAFAYHTLYPGPLQPAARFVAAALYAVVARCVPRRADAAASALPNGKPSPPDVVAAGATGPGAGATAPKASAMDTERRRQRALKVLDERLNANAAAKADAAGRGDGGSAGATLADATGGVGADAAV